MEAVVRELVRRNVVSDVAVTCALDQQVADEVAEVLPRPSDVLTAMKQCRELAAVVLVGDQRMALDGVGASPAAAGADRRGPSGVGVFISALRALGVESMPATS